MSTSTFIPSDSLVDVLPVQESHWSDLKSLRLASLQDSPQAFGMRYDTAAAMTEAQWRERAAGIRAKFFIAREAGRAVGLIGVTPVIDGDCELIAMWMQPSHRGTGVASMLVQAVKDAALTGNAVRVHLAVSPDNRPAARFYEKQGFAFLPEFERLESDASVTLQKMAWHPVSRGSAPPGRDQVSKTCGVLAPAAVLQPDLANLAHPPVSVFQRIINRYLHRKSRSARPAPQHGTRFRQHLDEHAVAVIEIRAISASLAEACANCRAS